MNVSSILSYSTNSYMTNVASRLAKSQQGTSDAASFAAQIIQQEDKNGDGMISADESRIDSKRFTELDTDSDGLITQDELLASAKNRPEGMGPGRPPMGPPPTGDPTEMATRIIGNDDRDGDGAISLAESPLNSEEFGKIDMDGSGTLSVDELTANFKARQADMAQHNLLEASEEDSSSSFSLMPLLAQNSASAAYGGKNQLYNLLQSAAQNLSVSA